MEMTSCSVLPLGNVPRNIYHFLNFQNPPIFPSILFTGGVDINISFPHTRPNLFPGNEKMQGGWLVGSSVNLLFRSRRRERRMTNGGCELEREPWGV